MANLIKTVKLTEQNPRVKMALAMFKAMEYTYQEALSIMIYYMSFEQAEKMLDDNK